MNITFKSTTKLVRLLERRRKSIKSGKVTNHGRVIYVRQK